MTVHNPWLEFAIQVAIGTIAGGFSDTVAVWMLFRPRRQRFGFQGAIPKNQPRLAKSIGRTVGERLLTPHDLMEEIARSGLRDALERPARRPAHAMRSTKSTARSTDDHPAELVPAVEKAMQDFLTRFVNDLPFRERMVARLVLTDRTVEKIVEALEQPDRPARPLAAARHRGTPRARTVSRDLVVDRAADPDVWSSASAYRRWWSARCWPSARTAIEELIRGVIDRELRLIIRTGYVLGGLIAVVLFGITKLVGLAGRTACATASRGLLAGFCTVDLSPRSRRSRFTCHLRLDRPDCVVPPAGLSSYDDGGMPADLDRRTLTTACVVRAIPRGDRSAAAGRGTAPR